MLVQGLSASCRSPFSMLLSFFSPNLPASIVTLPRVQEYRRLANASKVVWRVGALKALCRARCIAPTTDPETGRRHDLLFSSCLSQMRDGEIAKEKHR